MKYEFSTHNVAVIFFFRYCPICFAYKKNYKTKSKRPTSFKTHKTKKMYCFLNNLIKVLICFAKKQTFSMNFAHNEGYIMCLQCSSFLVFDIAHVLHAKRTTTERANDLLHVKSTKEKKFLFIPIIFLFAPFLFCQK